MSAPFQKHSTESQVAAETVTRLTGKRAEVFRFIASRGINGATDDEIQIGLGMNPSTERPRRVELYEAQLIVKLKEQQRLTRSGKPAALWVVKRVLDTISPSVPRTCYFIYPEDRRG